MKYYLLGALIGASVVVIVFVLITQIKKHKALKNVTSKS